MVYPCKGKLFISKKEKMIHAIIWMAFKDIMLSEKKGYILYDFIFMTLLKWQNYSDGEPTSGYQISAEGKRWLSRGNTREFCCNGTIVYLDYGDASWVCTCDTILQNCIPKKKKKETKSSCKYWWNPINVCPWVNSIVPLLIFWFWLWTVVT